MKSEETESSNRLNRSLNNSRNQKQQDQEDIWNKTIQNEAVLEMDMLPESTRFTSNVNTSLDLNTSLRLVDVEDEEDLMNDSHNVVDENTNLLEEVVVYVQRNSRLKLVLLVPCANMVQIPYEEIIRIVIIYFCFLWAFFSFFFCLCVCFACLLSYLLVIHLYLEKSI